MSQRQFRSSILPLPIWFCRLRLHPVKLLKPGPFCCAARCCSSHCPRFDFGAGRRPQFVFLAATRSLGPCARAIFSACLFRPVLSLPCSGVAQAKLIPRLLQGEAGVVLELLDQKARGLLVLIILSGWFFERARKLFDEMPKRT
jgi:hypothetical protein